MISQRRFALALLSISAPRTTLEQSLLAQLGWPSDQDRVAASRTRFQDLLRLPRRRLWLRQ